MRKVFTTLFVICILSFIGIVFNVILPGNDVFDKEVIAFVARYRPNWMLPLMEGITFFGSGNFLVPAYSVIIILLFVKRRRYDALGVLTLSLASLLIISEFKLFFHRHRPDQPLIGNIATFSFPSGHSFSSVVFFGVLAFLIAELMPVSRIKSLLIFLVVFSPFVIGLSRVILNVHYLTDVLAGFSLGYVWLVLCYLVLCRRRGS